MIQVEIPGYGTLEAHSLVLDFNGTLACGGRLMDGLKELIATLAGRISIYVVTADTFGSVEAEVKDMAVELVKLGAGRERLDKLALVRRLGPDTTVSIGNGNNDVLMLKESVLGICVMGHEGCAKAAMDQADLVIGDIRSALELLIWPDRLKATLRY